MDFLLHFSRCLSAIRWISLALADENTTNLGKRQSAFLKTGRPSETRGQAVSDSLLDKDPVFKPGSDGTDLTSWEKCFQTACTSLPLPFANRLLTAGTPRKCRQSARKEAACGLQLTDQGIELRKLFTVSRFQCVNAFCKVCPLLRNPVDTGL